MTADAAITIENACKRYAGPPSVDALRGVTLTIRRGERVAIVGASGSGKSSLMNLIGTLDLPTSGRVSVLGLDLTASSENQRARLRRESIGFVFQAFHLLPSLSALENVELALRYKRGKSHGSMRRTAYEFMDAVGLGNRSSAMPEHLSGGEQQRVAIARALCTRPELLLLDEPTGNLDTQSADTCLDVLSSLVDSAGTTTVLVTHDDRTAAWSDRRLTAQDGHLTEA